MSSAVLRAAAALRKALAALEPESLAGRDCALLTEELAAAEKACAAARLLLAARAVGSGAHRDRGFRDGAAWLARHTGATANQARQSLETAGLLNEFPATKAAFLVGDVSVAQASEITRAEPQTPGAEAELLQVARESDLSKVRESAREHRAVNTDPRELHRLQHHARHFRHWRDRLGMVCFSGALTPEVGVPFVHRLESATQRMRRENHNDGSEHERWEATAADALSELLSCSGPSRSGRAELVIVCDLFAWRRGHAHRGETCRIVDGGPVPVELAHELTRDAFLKAALHDGVALHTIKHFGRHLPAELRTALDLGPVPSFTGAQCADCGSRWGLEYDHVNPIANGGATQYSNLQPRCWQDHQEKTDRDRRAGLLGSSRRGPPGPD